MVSFFMIFITKCLHKKLDDLFLSRISIQNIIHPSAFDFHLLLFKTKKFIRSFITSVEWKQFLCPKTALIYGAKTSFLNHYSCIDDCLGVGYNDNHTCWLIASHFWGYFRVYLFTKHGTTIKRTSQKPLLTLWH